jgi:hypothetical protein
MESDIDRYRRATVETVRYKQLSRSAQQRPHRRVGVLLARGQNDGSPHRSLLIDNDFQ